MKQLVRTLALLAGLGLAAASSDVTAATQCKGPLSGKVNGRVVVNAGDVCFLTGATVSEGVLVRQGGTLIACGSTINDGVVSNRAVNVYIGLEEIPDCAGNVIRGGVWVFNTGPGDSLAIENSTIKGGMFLIGNQGIITIGGNVIKGNLFCKDNVASVLIDEGLTNIITGRTNCSFGK